MARTSRPPRHDFMTKVCNREEVSILHFHGERSSFPTTDEPTARAHPARMIGEARKQV